jgi:hypothetical protein
MFKFDNNHIFTGYLKQLLSSVNIPMCKIYTSDFTRYLEKTGTEHPEILESFNDGQRKYKVNYLKNNELYNYYTKTNGGYWEKTANLFYDKDQFIPGLTKTLISHGNSYDSATHEYLGDYLRFIRDYYNINLMSLYNCFNNKIYNNIYHELKVANLQFDNTQPESSENTKEKLITVFSSQDAKYNIYAFPVKLFAKYTIAIDCNQGFEMFCGLYKTHLDTSNKGKSLIQKTYTKINKSLFKQPFIFDKLIVNNWLDKTTNRITKDSFLSDTEISCWDIVNREQDLKLFIKLPITCKSSVVVLEGDFRNFNDTKYSLVGSVEKVNKEEIPTEAREIKVFRQNKNTFYLENDKLNGTWEYKQNQAALNFSNLPEDFRPVGKIQLLAVNTGESYPFATRLVEYLSMSAVTPIDEMPDNIKRTQRVMNQNHHYFKIEGVWEDKMQSILYDSLMSAGPVVGLYVCIDEEDKNFGKIVKEDYEGDPKKPQDKKIKQIFLDKRQGYLTKLGKTSKSTLFDVLGFVDKDAEKWYASWDTSKGDVKISDTIHSVDIYDGLYNL